MFARGQGIKKQYQVSNVCSGTRNKEAIPGVQCLLGDKGIKKKYLVSNVCSGTRNKEEIPGVQCLLGDKK